MSTICRHLLALVDTAVGSAELRISLSWDSTDPYAVTMEVHGATTVKRWLFAWDLLAEGRLHEAGIGDVRIRPAGPGRVQLVLMPGSAEQATLTIASAEVVAFLAETWLAEPPPIPDCLRDINWGEVAS
jgi:Streptomyces sporulation and cell division protein, SsgA